MCAPRTELSCSPHSAGTGTPNERNRGTKGRRRKIVVPATKATLRWNILDICFNSNENCNEYHWHLTPCASPRGSQLHRLRFVHKETNEVVTNTHKRKHTPFCGRTKNVAFFFFVSCVGGRELRAAALPALPLYQFVIGFDMTTGKNTRLREWQTYFPILCLSFRHSAVSNTQGHFQTARTAHNVESKMSFRLLDFRRRRFSFFGFVFPVRYAPHPRSFSFSRSHYLIGSSHSGDIGIGMSGRCACASFVMCGGRK